MVKKLTQMNENIMGPSLVCSPKAQQTSQVEALYS